MIRKAGNWIVNKWENAKSDNEPTRMDTAAADGDLAAVTKLHADGAKCTYWAIDLAASHGYLNVITFLDKCSPSPFKSIGARELRSTSSAMDMACKNGHMATVKYLHETMKAPHCDNSMAWACAAGQLDIVKYLTEKVKMDYYPYAIIMARKNNHTLVVQYLEKYGHPHRYSKS